MLSRLFGVEALVREPYRLGSRDTRWTRGRTDPRRDRNVADRQARQARQARAHAEEQLRAAKLSRTG